MIKKIILSCIFLIFFIFSAFASKEYDNTILKKGDVTALQNDIKSKLTPAQYEKIQNHFLEKGQKMDKKRVDELLSDGDYGEVTRFAESLVKGGSEKAATAGSATKSKAPPPIGPCTYDGKGSVIGALKGCVGGSDLVQAEESDLKVKGGFKTVIIGWIQRIAGFLALGAIFAIAFGSLRLTLSMGEEDQIKKAKDIIKWGVLGFLGVISAGFLIALVVNVIYSVGG